MAGDLRIIPMGNTFIVELTYRVGREESNNSKSVSLNPNEALCCDLGIDNFAAFVSTKPGVRPFLVKGKILKSINQRYNKQVAELKSKKHYEHIRIKGVNDNVPVPLRQTSEDEENQKLTRLEIKA